MIYDIRNLNKINWILLSTDLIYRTNHEEKRRIDSVKCKTKLK